MSHSVSDPLLEPLATGDDLSGAEPQPLSPFWSRVPVRVALIVGALLVAGMLAWQGITAAGSPDPTTPNTTPTVAVIDIGVLIFREGLECILVLAALTAGMNGKKAAQKRPVLGGVALGFLATLVTWFIAAGIVSDLTDSVSALDLQAATGLLAVVVLLVVMNWFFHKVYWGGWISLHSRTKKSLSGSASQSKLMWGLVLLGFASLYREGFEIVLFLQSYYLKLGGAVVLQGTLVGLFFSGIVAVLTFIAHRRLPYRKMLILTGVMLGAVLLVMVGEQAQEMQLAHWIPTTEIAALKWLPDWAGVWFAVFPTVETLAAQGIAALIVVGSYFAAGRAIKKEAAAEAA